MAMVAALAPLAGPYGLAASGVATAAQQIYDNFSSQGTGMVTMEDLVTLQAKVASDWNQLAADVAAKTTPPGPTTA
jgi:hypothetical protein